MSTALRRRKNLVPRRVPWTELEDELVRTQSAAEAARKTGRSLGAIYARRWELGVRDGRRTGGPGPMARQLLRRI